MWKYSFSAFSLPLLQLHLSLSGRRLLIRMNMGEGTMHIQRVSPKTTPTPISNYSPLPFNLIPHYLNVILCGAGASLFIPYRCYLTTLLVSRPTHRKEPLLVRPNEEEKKAPACAFNVGTRDAPQVFLPDGVVAITGSVCWNHRHLPARPQ